MNIIRAALTQTVNAYADMPDTVEDLPALATKLETLRDTNIQHHLDLIAVAAKSETKVICLGELFSAPYFALSLDKVWLDLAEDATSGPTISAMIQAAKQHTMVIVAPIYELDAASDKRFNTAVVIDADGSILGTYRKTHIPCGANEQGAFDESFYYNPGTPPPNLPSPKILGNNPSFPVFKTAVGNVGITICYDRHFQGAIKSLVAAGAEIVLSPAVTFGDKSRRMWDLEFEVDAARHNLFIGGSNRLGSEPPWNQDYFGSSYFVGPNGRSMNISNNDNLVIADLNLAQLTADDPSGWNIKRDTRPDIYS